MVKDNQIIAEVLTACPECNNTALIPEFTGLKDVEDGTPGEWVISKCQGCGLVFLSTRPTVQTIKHSYPQQYYTQHEQRKRPSVLSWLYNWRYRWRAMAIINRMFAGCRIVELGCGDGQYAAYLRRIFPTVVVDAHDSDLDLNRPLPVVESPYDVIILYGVLEHVHSPRTTLNYLKGWLSPTGVIVCSVPNYHSIWRRVFGRNWGGLQIPRHQVVFTPQTMDAMVQKTGLRVIKQWNVYDPGDLGIALCNWLSVTFNCRTPPRKAWFFLPAMLVSAPLVFLQNLFRNSGEIAFEIGMAETEKIKLGPQNDTGLSCFFAISNAIFFLYTHRWWFILLIVAIVAMWLIK